LKLYKRPFNTNRFKILRVLSIFFKEFLKPDKAIKRLQALFSNVFKHKNQKSLDPREKLVNYEKLPACK